MEISLPALRQGFEAQGYIAGEDVLLTVYLALKLEKPLLVTGAPGVGKTELAKVLAEIFQTELIRLQCYEGLDENKALYEWDYQRQLLRIEISRNQVEPAELEKGLFAEEYLLERPLLRAIRQERPPVLLIDEIDKTDAEFEAFLFEVLSDFQVSIPELGTVKARCIPVIVLTSNGERELSDGLKRRCLFLYIDYPSVAKEVRIIESRVPGAGERLSRQVAAAANYLRTLDLKKKPSIAETLDWVRALVLLDADRLDPVIVDQTINTCLKDQEDLETFRRASGPEQSCRFAEGAGKE